MVLDPIPQSLPVHFLGLDPSPPPLLIPLAPLFENEKEKESVTVGEKRERESARTRERRKDGKREKETERDSERETERKGGRERE